MCGIAGSLTHSTASVSSGAWSALRHRGPEDSGTFQAENGGWAINLYHHRLKIVDLSEAGHQPMHWARLSIVFNGEIYNYLELRRVLEGAGCTFRSSCDTEIILAAYQHWGVECLKKFSGMFAFAIWDDERAELVVVRDRLGKKPVFYSHTGAQFVFGSEPKAILRELRSVAFSARGVDDYLSYLYTPYPGTAYEEINQVPPGSWIRVRAEGDRLLLTSGRYWLPSNPSEIPHSVADLSSHLQDLVAESVRSRLISDVPLGVLLSGGMDSSTITAMMARSSTEPVRSFSIGFPQHKTYDEIPFAQLVARQFGAQHEVLEAEPSCSKYLAKIIWHFDQPFGNPTAVLTYMLSALTKKSVTVALAGDGGDELFGGYPRYIGAYMSNLPRSLPGFIRNKLLPMVGNALSDDVDGRHQFRRIREFLEGCGMPLIEMYLRWVGYFSPEEKAQLYTDEFRAKVKDHDPGDFLRNLYQESEGLEPLNRLAYVDIKSFLCCNVLEYADRMSMAHALELRAPFCDHRLVEFCLRLPFHFKFRYGESKWLLKQAMKPFLPPEVLNKRKLGFNPPVGTWLNGELKNLPNVLLSPKQVDKRGLFKPAAIQNMLDLHASKRRDYALKIWALMMLEIWFQIYIDGTSVENVQNGIDAAVAPVNRSWVPVQ